MKIQIQEESLVTRNLAKQADLSRVAKNPAKSGCQLHFALGSILKILILYFIHQTPRIALFVRSSVPKKHRIIYTAYIHNRIIDLCNVHHTSVHHTYMIQEASYIHKSQKRCVVSCIIHSGSRPKIISMCIIHIYVSGSMIEEHRYMHHTCIACIRIKHNGKCIIHMCIVTTCIIHTYSE